MASSFFSARDIQNSHVEAVKALFMHVFYPHIVSRLHGQKAINTFRHKQSRGGNPTVIPAVRALKMTEADRTFQYPDRISMAFGSAQPALTLLSHATGMAARCLQLAGELLQQTGRRKRLQGELRESSSTNRYWGETLDRGMEWTASSWRRANLD